MNSSITAFAFAALAAAPLAAHHGFDVPLTLAQLVAYDAQQAHAARESQLDVLCWHDAQRGNVVQATVALNYAPPQPVLAQLQSDGVVHPAVAAQPAVVRYGKPAQRVTVEPVYFFLGVNVEFGVHYFDVLVPLTRREAVLLTGTVDCNGELNEGVIESESVINNAAR